MPVVAKGAADTAVSVSVTSEFPAPVPDVAYNTAVEPTTLPVMPVKTPAVLLWRVQFVPSVEEYL